MSVTILVRAIFSTLYPLSDERAKNREKLRGKEVEVRGSSRYKPEALASESSDLCPNLTIRAVQLSKIHEPRWSLREALVLGRVGPIWEKGWIEVGPQFARDLVSLRKSFLERPLRPRENSVRLVSIPPADSSRSINPLSWFDPL